MDDFLVGSLFSGIGGIELGLEYAGMTTRWLCEIDPFCRRVLARNFEGVPVYDDVRTLPEKLPKVDLIAGGPPCQPHSIAGRHKGTEDSRWLWDYFIEAVWENKPRWVLMENVAGLRTKGLSQVIQDIADIGYDAEWDLLPAAAFGAPFLRERLFVIAYPSGGNCPRIFTEANQIELTEKIKAGSEFLANANRERSQRLRAERGLQKVTAKRQINGFSWWANEPNVGRVVSGFPYRLESPHRLARLRALGNTVVPQVAEWLGNKILEYEV